MRCDMWSAVNVQTPFLFSGQSRQGFTPTIPVTANQFIEFIAVLEDGAKTRWNDRTRMHCAFNNTLVNARLMRHPCAVGRVPLRRIDVANHQRKISVSDGTARFPVGDKPAPRQFRGNHSEELDRLALHGFVHP